MEDEVYRGLSGFLRKKIGRKAVKLCLDGGFTCPNRDGHVGYGGCLFCSARGAGDFIPAPGQPIADQVREAIRVSQARRTRDCYIAYFQNFSGTYAPLERLKTLYDEALRDTRVASLAVATRPDCVDDGVADLLSSYAARCYVWVELGLQSANAATCARLNMGEGPDDFTRACRLLASRGIDVVAHLIVGLPGETPADARASVAFCNGLPVAGLKIHSLYVAEGCGLADLWRAGGYRPLEKDEYVSTVCEMLYDARPDLVIHRLTGDAPARDLLAPAWSADKIGVLNAIRAGMRARGWHQGDGWRATQQ